MKKRKILWGVGVMAAVLIVLPLFAAFEAHVVNVTAKIENALSVATESIDFGTVFPQEYLEEELHLGLSDSFLAEERVDDVEYVIRQKPKCGWTNEDGTNLLGIPTMSGHVEDDGTIVCPESDWEGLLPAGAQWGQLPLLCPYLSKHKSERDLDDQLELGVDAFHNPWTVVDGGNAPLEWTEAIGRLAKSDDDTEDWWVIDLAVPCFGDYCAQDWAEFVATHNEGEAQNAQDWVQPIENEHKVFGCDLWVEVTGVSEDQPEPTRYVGRELSFSSTGWAGHSCEGVDEYAVGGGTIGDTQPIAAEGIAEYGATVGGSTYPFYPHYTYNGGVDAPGGEEGYVVQNGATPQSMAVFVDCLPR